LKFWSDNCLALIGISAFIIPFIFSTQTGDPTIVPRFTFLSIFLLMVSIIINIKQKDIYATVLSEPLILIYITYIFSLLFSWLLTDLKSEGYFEIARIFIKLQLIIVAGAIFSRSPQYISQLAKALSITGLVVCLIGISQYHGWGFTDLPGLKVPYATMQHRNLFASFIFLTMPFSLFNLWESWNRYRSQSKSMVIWLTGSIFMVLITLYSLAISQSRAVWLGLILSIITVMLIEFYTRQNRTIFKPRLLLRKLLYVTLAGLILILIVLIAVSRYEIVYSDNDRIFYGQKH